MYSIRAPVLARAGAAVIAMALLGAACAAGSRAEVGSPGSEQPAGTESTTTTDEPDLAGGDPSDEFLALPLEDKIEQFRREPNSVRGAAVATAMGETGDGRWGAWLLDLYRLGRSTRIDVAAADAFAALSGIEKVGQRTDDYRNYGNWVYREGADPGPGYRDWKLDVYGSIDPEFSELLAAVADDVLLAQIQWGGVARGGIPELNQPERASVTAADWMVDDELVLGVVVEGQAVAYPVRILGAHEVANDEIAGVPVTMAYCTLCLSGLLFDRRVDDLVLDFQTSGLLVESNKIMVDNQTDSLWRHQTGVALSGPLEGSTLEQYPVLTTTWAEWVSANPDTEVLAIPKPIYPDTSAGNFEQPAIAYSYEVGEAYRFYYEDPDVWFPVFDTPPVFELKEPVIGLTDGTTELAVQVEALTEAGPQVFEVGDLVVAAVPTSSGARLYDVTGAGLAAGPLAEIDDAGAELLVLGDGTTWARHVAPQLFWFAWFGQHVETDWWPRQ